jgi:hypothetical protein
LESTEFITNSISELIANSNPKILPQKWQHKSADVRLQKIRDNLEVEFVEIKPKGGENSGIQVCLSMIYVFLLQGKGYKRKNAKWIWEESEYLGR